MTEESAALSCQQQFELITESNIKINGLSNINESLSIHYLIYKIVNLENGKHYIGQHKTENPLDKYMGSGGLITQAIAKHGIDKFVKTILFDFDNFEEMNEKEKELVPLSACYPHDKMSYNLREGGQHGEFTLYQRRKMSQVQKDNWEHKSKEEKERISKNHRDSWKHKSEEEKERIREEHRKSWRSKSPKDRHEHGMKVKAYFDNLPQEKKDERSRYMREVMLSDRNGMRGEKLKDHMSPEAYESWKKKVGDVSRRSAQNPAWHKKMSEVTSGKNNPMYGKNWQDFSTPERVAQWRQNLSQVTSGKNNPMYGKDSWANHTSEERAIRVQKFRQSINGKNKGKKCMKHPNETKWIYVKPEDVQAFLDKGYRFYSWHKQAYKDRC